MLVKITAVKAEEIWTNAFVADEDKVGDQVRATITLDGDDVEISAMGDTEDLAAQNLRQKVSDHYSAKKYEADLEINKAIGLNFFE